MKNFNDLVFEPHTTGPGKMATMFFDNGYGISVVRFKIIGLGLTSLGSYRNGYGSYTSNEEEWEIAVLVGDENDYELCYDTPITNDVIGYQSAKQVTKIMHEIQLLPAKQKQLES